MTRFGLGKGLDSLIPRSLNTVDENKEGAVAMLPLEKVGANPNQPRKSFDEKEIGELAASIREEGILQPVLVEKSKDGNYIIIAGERRTRAARLAGLKEIPAIIKRFTPEEGFIVSLIENVQRADLNPLEEALAYKKLIEITGFSQEEAAAKVGKSRAALANSMRLLKLSPEIQDAVKKGDISAGHARALLSVEDEQKREALFAEVLSGALNVRDTERRAGEISGSRPAPKAAGTAAGAAPTADFTEKSGAGADDANGGAASPPAPKKRDPELDAMEQKFRELLGTKVKLEGDFEKGVLKIDYYSMDDLDRLYSLIIGEK